VEITFDGPIWFWRGPAPWHFVTVPEAQSDILSAASELVTYGWGMVPVSATVGNTQWTTSLWPKDGGYIVPIKTDVRRAESLELDDTITVSLIVDV
jgi:hypothetical protein